MLGNDSKLSAQKLSPKKLPTRTVEFGKLGKLRFGLHWQSQLTGSCDCLMCTVNFELKRTGHFAAATRAGTNPRPRLSHAHRHDQDGGILKENPLEVEASISPAGPCYASPGRPKPRFPLHRGDSIHPSATWITLEAKCKSLACSPLSRS